MLRFTCITILVCCTLILDTTKAKGQEELLPLDSLYISTVSKFYENAENFRDEIWEGMKLAPVCLFRTNGPALLYKHPKPPESFVKIADELYLGSQKENRLFGATQVEINGILTAIIDYAPSYYSDPAEVYAELFHELHHVYQHNFIKQIETDNPAILPTYPENQKNDAIKIFEQKTLFNMCFEKDSIVFQNLLNQYYSCRLKRTTIIEGYMDYEETVENMEGPAFYCEYRFYNKHASVSKMVKENYFHKHFFGILTSPFYGRNSLRQRHLASGMALCYILDKHYNNWKSEFYSQEQSLFSFFVSKFKPHQEKLKIESSLFEISSMHTQEASLKHQKSYEEFMSQQGTKIILEFINTPSFEGFDPMNAEAVNDSVILHSTLLKLTSRPDNELSVINDKAITVYSKELWFTRKVILIVPNESFEINDGRINISYSGTNVSWQGVTKIENNNEVIFSCD